MPQSLFPPLDHRSSGVLAHLSSLPSDFGIGTLGKEARLFIDFLASSGFSYWQMCPIGPTGFGDSPYQSFSTFAGNPYFIDFSELIKYELLEDPDLIPLKELSKTKTDYGALHLLHEPILKKAFLEFQKHPKKFPFHPEQALFLKNNQNWLIPYSTFRAFKKYFNELPFWEWDAGYKTYENTKKTPLYKELQQEIEFHKFIQFLFFHQWNSLHDYAKSKNIKLIGDIPIFIAHDSADFWANSGLFKLDAKNNPDQVAGVPPDYFSELGQLWGNPLYNWNKARSKCFKWWTERIKHHLKLFDVLRLDHFRGFESYWSIPANAPDARTGKWLKGPGISFFKHLAKELPQAHLIAEDLGIITKDVIALRDKTGLPGMAVLQFAFDNNPKNAFLPHNLTKNLVAYSGTHDNDTTKGWFEKLPPAGKDQVRRYFRISGNDIAWDFIHILYATTCDLVIITMQDLLNKGSEARLNFPGTSQGNWQWRFTIEEFESLQKNSSLYLQEIKWLYDR
ncbi:MAG: 4-alpha-glucanotransferase [Verrucomicrobia bacterium]|nr:MAG: 4-alpha-glucanotransferase [Verrucomicrobiota bacterium]